MILTFLVLYIPSLLIAFWIGFQVKTVLVLGALSLLASLGLHSIYKKIKPLTPIELSTNFIKSTKLYTFLNIVVCSLVAFNNNLANNVYLVSVFLTTLTFYLLNAFIYSNDQITKQRFE